MAGQLALIEPVDEEGEPITGVVLGDDDRLLVDLGASPGRRFPPSEVVASFFCPDALYRVTATASTPARSNGLLHLEVHAVERVQRRAARRARVSLPVSLSSFDGPGEFTSVTGETVDVAPGGCRVMTKQPLPPGVDPTVSIRLPGDEPVVALGNVLEARVEPGSCEYRIVFADISEADMARLVALADRTANP